MYKDLFVESSVLKFSLPDIGLFDFLMILILIFTLKLYY